MLAAGFGEAQGMIGRIAGLTAEESVAIGFERRQQC